MTVSHRASVTPAWTWALRSDLRIWTDTPIETLNDEMQTGVLWVSLLPVANGNNRRSIRNYHRESHWHIHRLGSCHCCDNVHRSSIEFRRIGPVNVHNWCPRRCSDRDIDNCWENQYTCHRLDTETSFVSKRRTEGSADLPVAMHIRWYWFHNVCRWNPVCKRIGRRRDFPRCIVQSLRWSMDRWYRDRWFLHIAIL